MNWSTIFDMDSMHWRLLDQLGIIISILTFIVSLIIWYRIRGQTKMLKYRQATTPSLGYEEAFEYFKKVNSHNPKALSICLIPGTVGIKDEVNDFLKGNNISISKENIIELNLDGIEPTSQSMGSYIQQLRELRRGPLSDASEVHLFIAGPMQAAVVAGAVLDNWKPVIIYNKTRDRSTYEYWGPLVKI